MSWFAPQTPAAARHELILSWDQGAPSGSPMWRPKDLDHLLLISQVLSRELLWKYSIWDMSQVPMWDASAQGGELACCVIMLVQYHNALKQQNHVKSVSLF